MPKAESLRPPKAKPAPSLRSDILMSIKPEHMSNIVSRKKNHEFRKYLISEDIKRIWFYVSSPDQHLRYIAVISKGKAVGEIEDETGLGNVEFNKELKESKYGYEILHLYQILTPLSSSSLKSSHSISPPQRYPYVPKTLFDEVVWDEQAKLF